VFFQSGLPARRRPVFAAVLAALLIAGCGPRRPPQPLPQTGARQISFEILEDWDNGEDLQEVRKDFDLFRELGISTWRGSLSWLQLEPERGRYDFEWLHRFADLAASRGITLRPYIAYTPAWAASGPKGEQTWNRPPRSLDDWYGFVRALAGAMRRHPNIISYEIYNEENVPQWWDGTAERYADTLERAAEAIRSANPRAQVLLGGMVYPDVEWIRRVCADGRVRRAFAIVPFHAYPETWTPEDVTVERYLGPTFASGFVRAVDSACGPKPIWINETGFATVEGRSERDQAEWWERAVATFASEPRVEEIGVYEIKDLSPDRPAIGGSPNYHLGITRADRTKKLAFYTIRRLAALIGGAPLAVADAVVTRGASNATGEVFAHAFVRPDGTQLLFVWSNEDTIVDVRLPRAAAWAVEYGIEGEPGVPHALGAAMLSALRLRAGDVRLFEIRP